MNTSQWVETITVSSQEYIMYSIQSLGKSHIKRLPYSMRILLENLMRNFDGRTVTEKSIQAILQPREKTSQATEIPFYPARVLMQDFTGVPAAVDLSALRDAATEAGKQPSAINPKIPVDLVIDHSVQVDYYGSDTAAARNVEMEYSRNSERYSLLKWAQKSFRNFRVVPPNSGICHQVNLEYLADVIRIEGTLLRPDSLVGTDSHTTMINGLGVMGWGVGGIEAEAVMLGQPYFMPVPRVIGVRLSGSLCPSCTATDLVLSITQLLRSIGVVGTFVEFFGEGLQHLDIPDRATIANMSPEYGATMGFFPVDEKTIEYLRFTGRDEAAQRVLAYTKANAMFHEPVTEPAYDQVLDFSLDAVEPSIAGPARPQDRILLAEAKEKILSSIEISGNSAEIDIDGTAVRLTDGSLVIAAITSCTNTSNPAVMLGAALLAKNAVQKGLRVPPWVKTSLAPGSKVVMDYLDTSGLLPFLEKLGFHLAAFGCTTCIGNSGPLHPAIEQAQIDYDLTLTAALSGNRNFNGRIHSRVKASFLMSPILVAAYALAGTAVIDFTNEPIGTDRDGKDVYLDELWPGKDDIQKLISANTSRQSYITRYADIFSGDKKWEELQSPEGETFSWNRESTYIAQPPFFRDFHTLPEKIPSIHKARALLVLEDSVTTDHISPAGSIDPSYPAGKYLQSLGISEKDFNSYGSRRGNHEVMLRGTFANTRIRQLLTAPKEGGITRKFPEGTIMHVYDAAMKYKSEQIDVIVFAGKEYGTGSSRDWAAKGTALLGIKAVIARSFERIHRSNLVGMGVLPLAFRENESWEFLGLTGEQQFSLNIPEDMQPGQNLEMTAESPEHEIRTFTVICRLDSDIELEYYLHGGILPYVLRDIVFRQPD